MHRIHLIILLLVMVSACKKSETSCTSCAINCSHQNGGISGNWKLESFRSYSAPANLDPPWNKADPDKPVQISFTNDSLFTCNGNFTWNSDGYDRYKIIDSADFIVYSSSPQRIRPLFGKILNAKEIQIEFMGVDTGTEEKFSCF